MNNIEYLTNGDFENAVERGYKGVGWYFWDEVEQDCYGPYLTYDQALVALDKYAENLMNDKLKTTQDRIDEIMDNFNFNKVEETMKALNWQWSSTNGVPEQHELRKQARRLLKDVSTKNVSESDFRYYISTGGFKATKYFDGDLALEFIVSSWDNSI
jgi:hypothetical protein